MTASGSSKIVDIAERFKGAALILVGGVLLFFAIDNYIKVTNAVIGTNIRVPRVLEWSYDNLGIVPSVIIHGLIAAALILFGLRMLLKGKKIPS